MLADVVGTADRLGRERVASTPDPWTVEDDPEHAAVKPTVAAKITAAEANLDAVPRVIARSCTMSESFTRPNARSHHGGTQEVDGWIGPRVMRCSNGHLFTAGEGKRILGSVHFGPARLMRCPVDGTWGFVRNVDRRNLTQAQLTEAARYRA